MEMTRLPFMLLIMAAFCSMAIFTVNDMNKHYSNLGVVLNGTIDLNSINLTTDTELLNNASINMTQSTAATLSSTDPFSVFGYFKNGFDTTIKMMGFIPLFIGKVVMVMSANSMIIPSYVAAMIVIAVSFIVVLGAMFYLMKVK